MTRFAVGVDGGGTRTRAVIVDEQGDEVARGEASGAVVTLARPEEAANAVWAAVERAMGAAGLVAPADVLWAGLSGAGRPDAKAAIVDALLKTRVAERVFVGTDVEAAFHHAFGTGPGILLIAGTGSIGLARRADGTGVRVGGWGERIGDEGGGLRIGLDALGRVVRSEDGRDPPTGLRDPVLGHLGLADVRDLVAWIAGAAKGEVAALVPLVVTAADAGDVAARGVLADAVDALREHVETLLERSGPWPQPPQLALWGGLVYGGGPLHQALLGALPPDRVRFVGRTLDPPLGSAMLALERMTEGMREEAGPA